MRKITTLLTALLLALGLLTGSIAVPILFRPFYYAHIGPLGLCAETGLSRAEIRTAYDEMLDFCLGGQTFSTGKLAFSEEGKRHFEDVRRLFLLDLRVLAVCAILLAGIFLYRRRKRRSFAPLLGHGPGFWAGIGLAAICLILGGLVALDFDRAFTIFHTLFFPGKTNWVFDPRVDEIILALPEVFFRNCAILILAVLLLGCALMVGLDEHARRRKLRLK